MQEEERCRQAGAALGAISTVTLQHSLQQARPGLHGVATACLSENSPYAATDNVVPPLLLALPQQQSTSLTEIEEEPPEVLAALLPARLVAEMASAGSFEPRPVASLEKIKFSSLEIVITLLGVGFFAFAVTYIFIFGLRRPTNEVRHDLLLTVLSN